MKIKDIVTTFIDSPRTAEIKEAISTWQAPVFPERLENSILLSGQARGPVRTNIPTCQRDFWNTASLLRERLETEKGIRSKTQLEQLIIDWLYDFTRLNVKRGRVFDLREVLKTRKADCLGYCKIFTVLGRYCGLDAGVVDVIVDNRGLAVPHTVVLVKTNHLTSLLPRVPSACPALDTGIKSLPHTRYGVRGRRFIDFWYGSKNIQHKKLGLHVRRNGLWRIEDIDFKNLQQVEDFSYLPDKNVDAITLYIEGNGSLKKGDYARAIARYSQAISLYPQNSRAFYNRAIAYEKLGQMEKAQGDYKLALQDELALKRTLASQPEEIVDLIELDERNIPELDQQIYLLYHGFVTGRLASPEKIAKILGLTVEKIESVLKAIGNLTALI